MDPKKRETTPEPDELPDLPESTELDELPELPDLPDALAPEPAKREPVLPEPDAVVAPKVPELEDLPELEEVAEISEAPVADAPVAEAPVAKLPGEALLEIDEIDEIDEIGELDELPEVEELEELPVEAAAASEPEGRREKRPDGERRELDRAPLLLRKAAVIVAIGSIAPWGSAPEMGWVESLPPKAILFLSAWIFHQSHVLTHHGKAAGFIRILGKKGPKPVWILATLIALVGFAPIFGSDFNFANLSEKVILLLATFTYTHIYDYEHGGKFNPIFPLMFLAPAVGGIGAIIKVMGQDPIAGAGAVVVTAGALFACYTMGVALKQAKTEGDAKRAAQRESRKATRSAGRSGGKSAGKPVGPRAKAGAAPSKGGKSGKGGNDGGPRPKVTPRSKRK